MNISGHRPNAEPVFCGEFEPEHVYLRGDTATWEGATFEALTDFRSGILPPPLVALDKPHQFWKRVDG